MTLALDQRSTVDLQRRQFLATAGIVLVVGLLAGVIGAALWAWVAPGVDHQVLPTQEPVPLPTATQHRFVALAEFAMIGVVIGVALAVLAWFFVATRGWPMLVFAGGCATAAAGVAGMLGQAWAPGLDAVSLAHRMGEFTIVEAAPTVTSWTGYLGAPMAAVLTYTLLVAWNGYPDLARGDGMAGPPPTSSRRLP
jgi:hypothetical protein